MGAMLNVDVNLDVNDDVEFEEGTIYDNILKSSKYCIILLTIIVFENS